MGGGVIFYDDHKGGWPPVIEWGDAPRNWFLITEDRVPEYGEDAILMWSDGGYREL